MLITTKTTISVVTFFRLAVYVTKGLIPKDHCQTSLPATKLFSHRCKKFLCTHMILPGKRVPVRTHFTLVLSGKSIFYLPFPPPPLPFIIFIFIFYFFYFLFFFLGVCGGVRGGGGNHRRPRIQIQIVNFYLKLNFK